MTDVKDSVVSLETAKRLQEAGIEVCSSFYWVRFVGFDVLSFVSIKIALLCKKNDNKPTEEFPI